MTEPSASSTGGARRLAVYDPQGRFACGSCTLCCSQPWATLIETEKAEALDAHDWSAYPQLAGKTFHRKDKTVPAGMRVLAKGEGTDCLFLDTDGLCIIHKELGPAAKPAPCLQFPYLVNQTPLDYRVSLSYACPTAAAARGPALEAQRDEVEAMLQFPDLPTEPDATIPLTAGIRLDVSEADAVYARIDEIFGADGDLDIWERFARVLRFVSATAHAAEEDRSGLPGWIGAYRGPADDGLEVSAITRYEEVATAPSQVRLLFAATLVRDILPPDATLKMGLLRRVTLLPRLASLAKFNGSYDSRILKHRVTPADVMAHPVGDALEQEADALLVRYFRARYWQRSLAGGRLSLTAGTHQHIQDLNAIVFLARALALHRGEDRLTGAIVADSLSGVEFAVSNQARSFDQNVMGWFEAQLEEPAIAAQSLRFMALRSS